MNTLAECQTAAANYLRRHWNNGGTSEFDQSINGISRATIEAMKAEKGECWMFKINRYKGDEDKPFMVEYTGQMVYNFEYAAIVPCYDKELENLLKDYTKDSGYHSCTIMQKITAIMEKIDQLGGVNLTWS